MDNRVVVICGPTASGKTALGVALAKALDGEVVSADSMQVYRGMDVGTAKPTVEEMEGVPHHMLDVADPNEDFSVARYVDLAAPIVEDILARGKRPLLVGGTGLYLDNLLAGRSFPPFSGKIRQELTGRVQAEGLDKLYAELGRVDPVRQAELNPNDEKRILRALEIYYETDKPMSVWSAESKNVPPRFEAARIGLDFRERADLWARIDRRVDQMMENGLEEEARGLLQRGVPPTATAMQAIGYKELTAALLGYEPLEAAVETVKLRTRQYAKRQLSWFRRYGDTFWIRWEKQPNFSRALSLSTAFLKECGL